MTPDDPLGDPLADDLDRLLAGDGVSGDDLAPMAGLVAQLRSLADADRIVGGAAWVQAQSAAAAAAARDAQVVAMPSRTGRRLRIGLAAAAASIVLTGGLAAADTLPRPAQHLVSRAVGVFGLDVPDPDAPDENERDNDRKDQTDHGGTSTTIITPETSVAPTTSDTANVPPVTDPPVTDPPVTDPPVTDPPVTDPPMTDPPVTNPGQDDGGNGGGQPPVVTHPTTPTPPGGGGGGGRDDDDDGKGKGKDRNGDDGGGDD